MSKGFTLIELVVTIAIIAVLSGIILFSVTQYISKGKDSNISGNLAILIPSGEVFYNGNSNSYDGFCDPSKDSVIKTVVSQMQLPQNSTEEDCSAGFTPGVCCNVATQYFDAWAACAQEFTNTKLAYCVDSRAVKQEICNSSCISGITACPDDDTTNCS